ncbi:hypothetical protein CBM2586_P20002 [Cupriavidus phytorum]|uniref:Uncharacterized protein n=1 Tax=Cupriavidus taiwanensis TaxID=164546 RepID=A0A375CQR0_9BURK|nr:hypothetical protein CBM2585_P20002 [Cupriavidus taiwanensis]SOY77769.1 hypothetical protein CBM2586_P20002 [Cupriavidus taiwanensis]
MPDGRSEVALPTARRAEDQHIGTFLQPGITARQCHHVRLGDHGHSTEVEGSQRLGWIQAGFGSVSFDTPLGPFGQFVFEQGAKQPGCLPAFLVGALCELWPEPANGGQAQFVEHQRQAGGINWERRVHAATPWPSRAS